PQGVKFTPASVTGVVVEGDAQLPDAVYQMLALREHGAADVVTSTASVLLAPIAAGEVGAQLQLSATEAWLPSGEATDLTDDVFVLAKQEGDRIREHRINSTRTSRIDTIDF